PPGKPRRRRAIRESSSRSPRRLTSWRDIGWQESAGGQLLIDRRAVEYEVHGNRRPDRSGRFIDPAKGDRQNEEWKKGDRVVVCSSEDKRGENRRTHRAAEVFRGWIEVAAEHGFFHKWGVHDRRQGHQRE